jgi:hypothetical protein
MLREAQQLRRSRDIQPHRQMSCRPGGQCRLRELVSYILAFGFSCLTGLFALVFLFLEMIRV